MLAIASVVAVVTSSAAAVRTSVTYPLSPALKLKTIRLARGPEEIRILRLRHGAVPDIQRRPRTSPAEADERDVGRRRRDRGRERGLRNDGRRVHLMMIDGELRTTGLLPGNAIAWSSAGARAYVGAPDLHMRAVAKSKSLFRIHSWNAARADSSVSAYTARGGTLLTPPGVASPTSTDPYWCAARLEPTSGLA